MKTQQNPTKPNKTPYPRIYVTVWFQAGQLVAVGDGYRVVPGTSVEGTVEVPEYRMATYLEQHIAQQYPGLTLVDWEIK